MSVANGQLANQTTFNTGLASKTQDNVFAGKQTLANPDSTTVIDIQKFAGEMADTIGQTENDANRKNYANNNYIADGDSRKVAIEKLDQVAADHYAELQALDAREASNNSAQQIILDDHEARLVDHETRITDLESNDMTIGGNKTFSGNVVVQGDFEVQGTVTSINSVNLDVEDALVTINKNGTNLTAENSGVQVERPAGNGQILFDSSLTSKWKIGVVGALYEVLVSGIAQSISGIKTFLNGIKTDTIDESTLNAGVTVETVLIKDGLVDGRDVSTDGTIQDNHIANTSNPHNVTASQIGLGNVTDDAQLKRAANDFTSFDEKTVVVAGDYTLIEDSADGFAKKKVPVNFIGNFAYESYQALVANGAALTMPNGTKKQLTIELQSTGGAVTLSTTPFTGDNQSSTPQFQTLIGKSDADNVTLVHADINFGCLLNGDCTLKRGTVINLVWSPDLLRYCEISRSQLGV